jgi:hypothetical protein
VSDVRGAIRALAVAVVVAVVPAASACGGRPFSVKTAPGFVELEDQGPTYAYRAIAPEGVAVAVRVVAAKGGGDLSFWADAVTLRMRQESGYALLKTSDVRSLDGTPGKELDFGHDEEQKPYEYRVRIFVVKDRLFLVETGGAKEPMARYRASVDAMLASVRVE